MRPVIGARISLAAITLVGVISGISIINRIGEKSETTEIQQVLDSFERHGEQACKNVGAESVQDCTRGYKMAIGKMKSALHGR